MTQEPKEPYTPNRTNKKESNRIGEPQMDNRIQLDQGTRRAPRERDG
jgi:hypothetical protein